MRDRTHNLTTIYDRPWGMIRGLRIPPATEQLAHYSIAYDAVQRMVSCGAFNEVEPQDRAFKSLCALAKVSPTVLEELITHIEHAVPEEQDVWYMTLEQGIDPDESYGCKIIDLEGGEYYRRLMAATGIAARICKDIKELRPSAGARVVIKDAESLLAGDYGKDYAKFKAAVIVEGIDYLACLVSDSCPNPEGDPLDDIRYISENLDEVERILDVMIARLTTDPSMVSQLIGSYGALTTGNL